MFHKVFCPLCHRMFYSLFHKVFSPLFHLMFCPFCHRLFLLFVSRGALSFVLQCVCFLCHGLFCTLFHKGVFLPPFTGCTMRRSTQRVTMPLMQQSGNALTERKCSALGELINTFVLVYVENLPAQADGSCVIQVPEIQVTCNTGSRNNVQYSQLFHLPCFNAGVLLCLFCFLFFCLG